MTTDFDAAKKQLQKAGILINSELAGFKDEFMAANDIPDIALDANLEEEYILVAKEMRSSLWLANGRCPECGTESESAICTNKRCDTESWVLM